MNHPNEDRLLLHGYGELPEPEGAAVDVHVTACSTCRARLERFERSRVALDLAARPARRHVVRWMATAVAAAAVIAAVLLTTSQPPPTSARVWQPASTWSVTAGYVAGGRALVEIDAQLTRLEQERSYGLPD